jgi:chromosome segregation ATPase
VFALWCVLYALELTGQRANPSSQVAFMRSNLLFSGSQDRIERSDGNIISGLSSTNGRPAEQAISNAREGLLAARVRELEQTLDEDDYQSEKKFKQQYRIIAAQRSELNSIKSATGQLQTLPEQLSSIGTRVGAAEARAGEGVGQAEAARQTAEGFQKQLTAKLSEVETRAARAAEQVGKVEDQASVLATRTEALEKELDRRARQIEARTEELGERTAGLKEREERIDRLQRIAFAGIFAELKSNVDELERRIASSFYRAFSKGEAKRDSDSIRERINALANELRQLNTDQAKQFIAQLDDLTKRLDQITARIK